MSASLALFLSALLTFLGPNRHPLLNHQTTVTADVTIDPSITPTETPTVTPSITPTETPTVTVTPTVTPSVSPSPSEDNDEDGDDKAFPHGKHKGFFEGLPFGFFVREMAHLRNQEKAKSQGERRSDE